MGKQMRLDKYLSNMGVASRRELKICFKKRLISVNGEVVLSSSLKVDTETDIVKYKGIRVIYREYVYLLLNKPQGVVSAKTDKRFETVVDIVREEYGHYDMFPVGRLDRDTEGLLILTNDGDFTHDLLSPKKHVPKTYFADIDGCVTEEHVKLFKEGIALEDGYQCMPADLEILSVDEENKSSEINITLHEGKFHQVKRMFEAVDTEVLYLKRVKMGNLDLDPELELGDYRELTEEEMVLLGK